MAALSINASVSSTLLSTCSLMQNQVNTHGKLKVHTYHYQRAFSGNSCSEDNGPASHRPTNAGRCINFRVQSAKSESKLDGWVELQNQSREQMPSVDYLADRYAVNVVDGGIVSENSTTQKEADLTSDILGENIDSGAYSTVTNVTFESSKNYSSPPATPNMEAAQPPPFVEDSLTNSQSLHSLLDRPNVANVPQGQLIQDSGISEGRFLESTETSSVKNPFIPADPSSVSGLETTNVPGLTFEEAQNSLKELFSSAEEKLQSSVSILSNNLQKVFIDASEFFSKSGKNLFKIFENAVSGLQNDLTSPFRVGTPANSAIKQVVIVVEDATSYAITNAVTALEKGYIFAKGYLPPEYQSLADSFEEKSAYVLKPVASAAKQIITVITEVEKLSGVDPENPIVSAITIIGGTVGVGILYWQYTYGGYSGDLTPELAVDLLIADKKAVLIDIRPEELKVRDGIPDLRRGARFRFATVEFPEVDASVKKSIRKANEFDDFLAALIIKNLRIVNGNTRVIVMDGNGSQSKRVARALRKLGIKKTYQVQGGFKSWINNGLQVKERSDETPFTILKEDTEAILKEERPSPGAIFAACVGLVAAINALIEWEKTLQLIGFIATVQIIYKRVRTYETAEDLKADVRKVFIPFTTVGNAILYIANKAKPNNVQLATSPSTTAVQSRVLQAAAKHGSSASQLEGSEQTQDPEPVNQISDDGIPSSVPSGDL